MADLSKQDKPNKPKMASSPKASSFAATAGGFLLKSLFCALFLFALPLFPSEAPAFISGTPFTGLWELLHLLFIGIAVSYGLFCRRNADDSFQAPDFIEPRSSRMENFLSIFDDGNHEKGQPQILSWDAGPSPSQGETIVFNENPKLKPFDSENSGEIPNESGSNTEVQSWNSQYFQCQPMIVVARPNYSLDDDINNKPLGLPVRSLRSGAVKASRTRLRSRSGLTSSSGSGESTVNSVDGCENENFGEMGPLNLEGKFDEAVSLPSPVPWNSRSRRMDTRKDSKPFAPKQPMHSRHLSVEESQFRHRHKSKSLKSDACLASHTSSASSLSPRGQSPMRSVTPDSREVKREDVREKKRDLQSSGMGSSTDGVASFFEFNSQGSGKREPFEKTRPINAWDWKDFSGEGTLDSSHARKHKEHGQVKSRNEPKQLSDDEPGDVPENEVQPQEYHPYMENEIQNHGSYPGSSPSNIPFQGENGPPNNVEEGSLGSGWSSSREDHSGSSYSECFVQGSSTLNPIPRKDKKKVSLRGKSVRTFRSNEKTMGKGKERTEQTGEGNSSRAEQHKDEYLGPSYGRKGKGFGVVNEFAFPNEDAVDRRFPAAENQKPPNYQRHDEKMFKNSKKTEEVAEFQANPKFDDGDDTGFISDACTEVSEVDRKASEFIAKFREQIRLQKTASIDSSSVLDITEDHCQL